jgi:soluble lytic murein transglycosylase
LTVVCNRIIRGAMKRLSLALAALVLTACSALPQMPAPAGTPHPNKQPTAQSTASPSPPPVETAGQTATSTPTATLLPTPVPVVRVATADRALFNGDYESARREYTLAFQGTTDASLRSAALWGLVRTESQAGNQALALDLLRNFVATYPEAQETGWAYFLLGQTYSALGRQTEAADAYSEYLTRRPGMLDSLGNELRGDALSASGDYQGALDAYRKALAAPHLDDANQLLKKIAQAYLDLGAPSQALEIYDQISRATTDDYAKAQMDLLAGRAELAMGQADAAYARFQDAVTNYPLSYDSYSALVALVNDNVPVSDFERGLVDYFAGQYSLALQAFDRYLASNPADDDGTAHHYRALSLRALGNYQGAVDEWDTLIANFPQNRYWTNAWDEKAFTQWADLDDFDGAAATLLDFCTKYPQASETPGFLFAAARIQERAGHLQDAAQTWESLSQGFSSSDQANEALFQAGIVRYRAGDLQGALDNFSRLAILATDAEGQARAQFWVGKTQQLKGDAAAAQAAWQSAQELDPGSYYSERARDVLLGRKPFEEPIGYNIGYNVNAERDDAEAWMRIKFALPQETDFTAPGPLAADPRLQRGTELWQLGLYDESRAEFEDLRNSLSSDALNSYRLGNYLLDLGLYRSAIYALRNVLTLAGLDDQAASLNAPAYFKHVRYGLYYSELIFPLAKETDIEPLLLTSIVRQESLFEGFVRSQAGAHGLMQLLPDTAKTVSDSLGWPTGYSDADIYRPMVNLRLGAHYLQNNRTLFGGDLYAALAAYNAGPGNAQIWQALSNGDPDLFVEVIRFSETRDYIRLIYQTYDVYRSLYSPLPQQ